MHTASDGSGSDDSVAASALSALPIGAFRADPLGRYVAVNDRWCELTGLERERALGDGWKESIHPDDVRDVTAAWHEALFLQASFEFEYRLARSEDPVWLLVRAAPDSADRGRGYLGVAEDITARVALEQQLRTEHAELSLAREQLAAALTSLEELVYTSELHPDGTSTLMFVGPGTERLLGGNLSTDADPFDDWIAAIHPDDRAGVIDAVRDPLSCDGVSRTYRVCGRDGIMRWIRARTRVRHAPDGRVLVDGVATDISNEHARDSDREQLAALVEASADLIAIMTLDLRVTSLNPAGRRLLGLTADAELHLQLADACAPDTVRILYDDAIGATQRGGSWHGAGRLRNLETGAVTEVEIALLLLRDSTSGQPTGYATIQRDLSEQRRLDDQLLAAERRLRSLVDSIGEVVYEAVARADRLETVFVGRALEQLLGRPVRDDEDGLAAFDASIHPHDRVAARARLVRVRKGFPDSSDLRIIRSDGDIRTVSISARPRRHRDGELTISGVIADVSDRAGVPQERTNHIAETAPTAGASSGLTPRQVEVLEMLGRGYNVPQIAAQLTLSPATVKNHSRAILKTLNVHSRAAALERARALGLIWAPPSDLLDARKASPFSEPSAATG